MIKVGGTKGATGKSNHLRHALIAAEVALSVVLLAGAGLLIRSFLKLQAEGPGFVSSTVTMRVATGDTQNRVEYHAYLRELISKVEGLPGVMSAGIVSHLPLTKSDSLTFITVDGYANEPNQLVRNYSATPGYFKAMGIRLIEGRFFDDGDVWDHSPKVAIINQAFAKKFFGSRDPIGRTVRLERTPAVIVGVIANLKQYTIDEKILPQMYGCMWQQGSESAVLVVRSVGPVAPLASGMRQAVLSLKPSATIFDVRTMDQLISESGARRRFQTSLLAVFAGIALMLALVGIYGMMTYAVKQRTPELGLRMTLGATRAQILAIVVRQGLSVTAIGLAVGIAGALALTRVLAASLYEVNATDPITFYVVPTLILLVSAAACFIPAWRATRIDPADALRYE